jgi:tetratricopeptide (TPR) repeat protein
MTPLHSTALNFIAISLVASMSLIGCGKNEPDRAEIVNAHLERSLAYQQQGQYKAATIEIRNIIKKDRENILGYEQLAKHYLALGHSRNAYKILAPQVTQNTPAQTQMILAEAYLQSGKFNSAQKSLLSYSTAGGNQNTSQYKLLQSKILVGKNQIKTGINSLLALIEQSPELVEPQAFLANVYLMEKQYDQAANVISTLLENHPNNATASYTAAVLAYTGNNLESAEKHLSQALVELPNTDIILPLKSKVLSLLSRVLTESGRTNEALIYSKLLASNNPEVTEAKNKLKQAFKHLDDGNLDAAEVLLESLTESYPDHHISAIYLGLINYHQGDYESAENLLSRHLDPETDSLQLIETTAKAKLKLQKINEAIAVLQQALENHPENERLLNLYGLITIQHTDQPERGVMALEKVTALNPSHHQARTALARHYIDNDKQEIGIAHLEQVLKQTPDNIAATTYYLKALLDTDQRSAANETITELLRQAPDSVQANNLAARFAISTEDISAAQRYYKNTLDLDINDSEAHAGLAQLALQNQETSLAKDHYLQIIEAKPDLAIGYKGLITSLELAGTHAEILTAMENYFQRFREVTATPAYVMSEYFLRKGNLTQAKNYLDKASALQQEPAPAELSAAIHYQQAKQSFGQADYDSARSQLVAGVQYGAAEPQLLALLAETEIRDNQPQEAQKIIQLLDDKYPEQILTDILRGKLAIQQNQLGAATVAFQQAWQKKHHDSIAQELFGNLKREEKHKEAIAFLEEWLQALPNSGQAVSQQALEAQNQGDYEKALQLFENATAMGLKNPSILSNMAWLYQKVGGQVNIGKAIKILEEASETNSNSPLIFNNLAWLYHNQSDQRAADIAAKAYKLAPDNAAIIDTYGWILFHNGQTEKAIELLKRANQLSPDNEEIMAHLKEANNSL